jgi:hypothetical protein
MNLKHITATLLMFVMFIACGTENTPTYTLTIEVVGSGTVNPAPGRHVYNKGDVVVVTASPADRWYFDRWEGTPASDRNPWENDIQSDITLRAIFRESPVYLAENGVTIRCPGSPIGSKGVVNGIEYLVVDRAWIIQNRGVADLTKVCVSNITDMSQLLEGSGHGGLRFNQSIGNWDVSQATTMRAMFLDSPFNQDISKWNVRNVVDMQAMFWNSPFNRPIGDWNVSAVRNMTQMFGRSSFNQPINRWCVSLIPSEPFEFALDAPLSLANKPVWGSCPP